MNKERVFEVTRDINRPCHADINRPCHLDQLQACSALLHLRNKNVLRRYHRFLFLRAQTSDRRARIAGHRSKTAQSANLTHAPPNISNQRGRHRAAETRACAAVQVFVRLLSMDALHDAAHGAARLELVCICVCTHICSHACAHTRMHWLKCAYT